MIATRVVLKLVLMLLAGAASLASQTPDSTGSTGSRDPFTSSNFVHVRPGSFLMGSAKLTAAERPVHEVTLTHGYWIQRYLVTQAQWQAVMGTNPSVHQGCPTCPVDNVSYGQVWTFISALNALSPGKKYRLPTEAEWEFAARFDATPGPQEPAASLALRSWMAVDVFEWVFDWYAPYPSTPVKDPTGPSYPPRSVDCACKVLRGGSLKDDATYLRSWAALQPGPAFRFKVTIGFRLAKSE